VQRILLHWFSILLLAAFLIILPVSADLEKVVIYSSDFSKDPGFTTNNPSRYFWDVKNGSYHFETEGGTNGYAFVPVEFNNKPFTLEYDITISSIERDGAVRFGVTSTDMDISKAVNVLGIFDNGQYGKLMGLQVIDQSNHLYEIQSLYSSYCGEQRDCETKQFEENVTYHVTIRYNKELHQADINVTDKKSGGITWGFYVPLGQELQSLSRLAITTKGDYLVGNKAVGYLDNVELSTYREVTPTITTTIPTTIPTSVTTTVPTTATATTPPPTKSPFSPYLAAGAFVLAGGLLMAYGKNRR
jgi:hypothetical protein